jgi:hypothetical protein
VGDVLVFVGLLILLLALAVAVVLEIVGVY